MSYVVRAMDTRKNQRPCEKGILTPSETRRRKPREIVNLAIIESVPRPISWMHKRNLILERVQALFHRILELH